MEIATTVGTELALSGLFRVMSILEENFKDVITTEEMKPLNDFVDYKIEALIRETKSDDLVQLMPSLEKIQAAALELEDLLDFYEYDQIEKQVSSSSSEPIPEEKVLPIRLRNGLDKLLMFVEQVENKRQSVTSKTGTSQPQADTITPTMELAAKVGTELALSGLFRVVSILNENFRDVKTTEEMKPLNDFIECKIEALIREAKSDDLVQLMPLLEELQTAALELEDMLDFYEYDQIEKQVNFSSSEPIPKEKVLPTHLRDGLNKLLKIVERVENIRESITTSNSFIDFLVGEFHVARPVIKLALSDISRLIKMLGSKLVRGTYYREIFVQLKDVVSYHIQALIRNVNSNDLVLSKQLLELLDAASLQLNQFDPYAYDYAEIQYLDLYYYTERAKRKEELRPVLSKSPLRIGLEKMLKFVEREGKKHSFITSITPTLGIGVEKWLKFVEQVEKEHPFITSKKGKTHPQDYTSSPISTTFFPGRGFLKISSLENGKCQEDAEEIMRNHKKNLKELTFGWRTNIASSTNTCKEVLERLEPDRNIENLSIIDYSCSRFPKWMEKENWLQRLQSLRIESCRNLKIIPFLPPGLQELTINDCPNLTLPSMFDLSVLTNLERLGLRGFPNLQALANLSPTVTELIIEDCPILTSLGNVQRCTSLERLRIFKCPMLRREEASLVEGVVQGDIANCLPQVFINIFTDEPSLVFELLSEQAFGSIKCLDITDCAAAAIPNLEKLSSLVRLSIEDCPDVESLPNLPVSLQELYIVRCPKIKMKFEEGGPLHVAF